MFCLDRLHIESLYELLPLLVFLLHVTLEPQVAIHGPLPLRLLRLLYALLHSSHVLSVAPMPFLVELLLHPLDREEFLLPLFLQLFEPRSRVLGLTGHVLLISFFILCLLLLPQDMLRLGLHGQAHGVLSRSLHPPHPLVLLLGDPARLLNLSASLVVERSYRVSRVDALLAGDEAFAVHAAAETVRAPGEDRLVQGVRTLALDPAQALGLVRQRLLTPAWR